MIVNTIILYLFAITSILYIVHLGFYLIGASAYDIWQHRRIYTLRKKGIVSDYAPHITILIPAHNEEKVIARCLNSVFASTYKNIEVIVVNDASTDATRRILSDYSRLQDHGSLRIINKRINVGKGAGLNYALRRYVRTELVMMLDADSVVMPQAIERAVSYFVDPNVAGVAANVQILNEHTTLSILQKFEHMISYQSKKAYSITNCDFIIGGVASTYRVDTIKSVHFYDTDTMTEDISLSMKVVAKGNKRHRIIYGVDVVALTESVESIRALFRQRFRWKYGSMQNLYKHRALIGANKPKYTSMLTVYRLPAAIMTEITLLLLPLTWIYAAYLTISHKSLLLVIGAYLTITMYVLVTLWYNNHLRRLERVYLTLYVPVAYFVFYVMDLIQIFAVIKCMIKARDLTEHKNRDSTWISPDRIGGRLAGVTTTTVHTRTIGGAHE
jgi:cellulose synthase/poly-beta-1,6-N-acetylglucosamine synthase-like glycosyltransferase